MFWSQNQYSVHVSLMVAPCLSLIFSSGNPLFVFKEEKNVKISTAEVMIIKVLALLINAELISNIYS